MELHPQDIHVWSLNLTTLVDEERNLSLLNAQEKARADRFQFPLHRQRFIAARAGLREILSLYLSLPPQDLTFSYSDHHKPALAFPAALQFNLSHSKDWAVYAIALDQAVGIDIEAIKKINYRDIAKRFYSPQENQALLALPETTQPQGFYQLWAKKEAVLKALGQGLALGLNSFTVSLEPMPEQIQLAGKKWTIVPLPIQPNYAAALAAQDHIRQISYWLFSSHGPKFDKVSPL